MSHPPTCKWMNKGPGEMPPPRREETLMSHLSWKNNEGPALPAGSPRRSMSTGWMDLVALLPNSSTGLPAH